MTPELPFAPRGSLPPSHQIPPSHRCAQVSTQRWDSIKTGAKRNAKWIGNGHENYELRLPREWLQDAVGTKWPPTSMERECTQGARAHPQRAERQGPRAQERQNGTPENVRASQGPCWPPQIRPLLSKRSALIEISELAPFHFPLSPLTRQA
ncbi:hypothetical protein B0T17DRAFT_509516 [Bombardia bombarda]|uniref:Uncharacterized protein n=1 Tax=Bombardia bombarda TaxID=252184 RepID=A0AA39WM38_9PEZI|nr:hypothetical protein B0T17DRAFT_509516 [Bombardia bombarda]